MPSFFTFTEQAKRARDDAADKPWPHMVLQVRRHENGKYRVQGDHPGELGDWYERAFAAVSAIRAFCRSSRYTASVTVYTRDNRHVHCVRTIRRT